ncbi:hypothetical protein DL240_04035 [Lujinxingia litoralis]|uniref:Carboxypeptidase regulatory-like domain-containing protein n=1 Tax=Lujinxingia litoralis TaxID=2211119 RepID=A0A328CBH3_9DELT|nr:carboxypeptidase-like regulatory domain-containing protein [Lujinxingia litoralis]RAL25388.1 hypothetical protein DL240_04035 [Lujinxingia litoralis]
MRYLRWTLFAGLLVGFAQGCGGCDEAAGPGEVCDPSLAEPCQGSDFLLVCRGDNGPTLRCLHPDGGRCSLAEDPSPCASDATCIEPAPGEDARCLLEAGAECDPEENTCAPGLACEATESGEHQCHSALFVQGQVFDNASLEAIPGAQIIAFNEEGSALSDVAVSDEVGAYRLQIPALRDAQGVPVQQFFTLRGSAADYQTFPGGLRTALPIDTTTASVIGESGELVIDTAQTDVALIELPASQQGFSSISGLVDIGERGLGGVLVVAESDPDTGISGVSARNGAFTIFNVPPGDYQLRGYIAGTQVEPEQVSMADVPVEDVILSESEEGLQDVSGQIQIVAASGGLQSSVVFVVASTFDEVSVRGEVPAGLRAPRSGAPNIDGEWTIEGVPAGDYYVLAGFENDELVRDPDEGIAGTELVRTTIASGEGTFEVTPSFKVTAALDTVTPGAEGPEGLTAPPTLTWGPASNAQWYDVVVFNAYGDVVWEANDIPSAGGSTNLSVAYEGPFEEGMYYQFRATAYRADSAISSTEDLRGVFYRQ